MRPFRHYIIEKDGRSLYLGNGVVSSTNQRIPLPIAPQGFQDYSLAYERDLAGKIGTTVSESISLGFLEDAAQILRDQFYRSTIERELYLLTTRHTLEFPTPTTYRHRYKHLLRRRLDFTTWQDDGLTVNLKVVDGGIQRTLKANGPTVYEIPIEQLPYDILKADGLDLSLTQNYLVLHDGYSFNKLISISTTTKEGEAAGFAAFDVLKQNPPSSYTDSTEYFSTTTQALTLHIKGSFKVSATSGDPYSLVIKKQTGSVVATLFSGTGNGATQSYEVDQSLTTAAGDKLFLESHSGLVLEIFESKLSLSFSSRYPPTYVKVLRPSQVIGKLLQLMGIPSGAVDTTYIEQWDDFVLLSGDANRGLSGAVLKTSYDKFTQFCKVLMAAGCGVVAENVRVEAYPYFFRTENPTRIPRIKSLIVSDATDLHFNTVRIGWAQMDIDDVNGRYSFNNSHTYGTPVNAVQKELNLVSDYVADPFVMEIHRLNLDGKTTTDSDKDNTVFVVDSTLNTIHFSGGVLFDTVTEPYLSFTGNEDQIELFQTGSRFTILNSQFNNTTFTVKRVELLLGGFNVFVQESVTTEAAASVTVEVRYRTLRRESYDTFEIVKGVTNTSIFNVSLNPAFLIRRHLTWINSVLYNFQGQYLKFLSTEKNREVKYTKGSFTFDQDQDIEIGADRLFLPFEIDVDSEEPTDLIEVMDQDPNTPFITGTVTGFIRKVALQPGLSQEQAYKLLLSPNTNLLTIHKDAYL